MPGTGAGQFPGAGLSAPTDIGKCCPGECTFGISLDVDDRPSFDPGADVYRSESRSPIPPSLEIGVYMHFRASLRR